MGEKDQVNVFSHLVNRTEANFSKNYSHAIQSTLKADELSTFIENHGPLFSVGSSDLGVALNGGRRGARYGAQAIINHLLKMSSHSNELIKSITTWEQKEESYKDFNNQQSLYASRLEEIVKNIAKFKNLIHLGGGHDHAFPMLKAIKNSGYKKIIIINLDAHCDTRIDDKNHSGTPFRQGDALKFDEYKVFQIGINQFSNSKQTTEPLKHGSMEIFYKDNLGKKNTQSDVQRFLNDLIDNDKDYKDTILFISLDCDAIDAAFMPGVSAINPNGLTPDFVEAVFKWGRDQSYFQNTIYGIYEYNPIFDTESAHGAKVLSRILYKTFLGK